MDMSASRPRTRILALTGEVELLRLLRSILEPSGRKVSLGALVLEAAAASAPVDIMIIDVENVALDLVCRVRLAHPGAEILAICGAYREADCIAILERDVDSLARPFRARDLAARVRVAELRRIKAAGHESLLSRASGVFGRFERPTS